MPRFLVALLCVMVLVIVGCSREHTKSVKPLAPQDEIRSVLEHVAQTGEIDSGLVIVRDKLEVMKETDAAKAGELLQDLNQLEKLNNQPAQAKAKAQEMLKKLGS